MTDEQCIAIIAAIFRAERNITSSLYDVERQVAHEGGTDVSNWGDPIVIEDSVHIREAVQFYEAARLFLRKPV